LHPRPPAIHGAAELVHVGQQGNCGRVIPGSLPSKRRSEDYGRVPLADRINKQKLEVDAQADRLRGPAGREISAGGTQTSADRSPHYLRPGVLRRGGPRPTWGRRCKIATEQVSQMARTKHARAYDDLVSRPAPNPANKTEEPGKKRRRIGSTVTTTGSKYVGGFVSRAARAFFSRATVREVHGPGVRSTEEPDIPGFTNGHPPHDRS